METVIYEETPLAEYLKDEGEEQLENLHAPAESERSMPSSVSEASESPPSSPSFAPTGRPMVRKRFRSKIPGSLRIQTPRQNRLVSIGDSYSKAVASRIDRADNSKFLEQFRYTIVASQLLSGHSLLGQNASHGQPNGPETENQDALPNSLGLMVTAAAAITAAWAISWVFSGGYAHLSKKRVVFVLVVLVAAAGVSHAYIRQQWLRHLRTQALSEVSTFVARSQDFDSASGATIALIQEVELVSRGYRISAPLPPISRIEDKSQTRRCVRLRKVLKGRFAEIIQKYDQVSNVVKGFSEQLDLEKYYDIYDISDFDISDAKQGFTDGEFEDPESLRALKIVAARFQTIRKIFLCALLALEARGDNTDFLRWGTAVEGLRSLNELTQECFERLRLILSEEETFPAAPVSQVPMSPGRERWRSQLRKLNSLSSGIRGLQAKLVLLREESDRTLNEAEDVSELGPRLLTQYESIGQDLKLLTQAWEEGKAALASGIDRNEKRLSSISSVLSPASSLSGLTTVSEGGALEALKMLNGESPPSSTFGSPRGEPEEIEVFEAIAKPRPRSMYTREERIVKMKEERERKEVAKEKAEANRGMLRELEMVINLRPRRAQMSPPTPTPERVSV